MKILIIATTQLAYTGITNLIFNYLRDMDRSGMDITVLSTCHAMNWCIEELEGLNIKYVELKRNENPIQYYKRLFTFLKKENFDIVHAHGNSNTLGVELSAAKMAKVKVRIAHCHSTSCTHKWLSFLLKPLLMNSYTHGFACSELAGKWLFGNRKFYLINNAFDVDKFRYIEELRNKYRKELQIEKKIVIGNVGLFNEGKNQGFLLDIFNEYKKLNSNSVLVFIGTGQLEEQIKKKVRCLGIEESVIFLGNRRDVNELLNVFDYFLFPSLFEGLGIVLLEAQANGLPVIASEDVIPHEVKLTDNFLFMPLQNGYQIWAEKVFNMSSNRNLNGLYSVKNAGYDIKKEADKLKSMYMDFISSNKND